MIKKSCTDKSREIFEETRQYLVDGVGSSFHISPYREYPVVMESGKGMHLTDVDGNDYIDYILGFGPMLLGHCNPAVNAAVEAQLQKGTHFSAPTRALRDLSKKLCEIVPCAESVMYQNSGTEAVMNAFRLARAYTGKQKIVKFEGQYHGWSDEEKVTIDASTVEELGSFERPNKIMNTPGQKKNSADEIIVLPWNHSDIIEKTLAADNDIAAVIMEPIMCDSGPILPKPTYLKEVREITKKYGVLLIFDEVITGFRAALGGAQEKYGVVPDIATFAKAIANGFPFAAIVGRKEIMHCGVHASGTFNANPLGTAAALAVIDELSKPGVYDEFDRKGEMLCKGFQELGKKYNEKIYSRHVGSIFILFFGFEEDTEDFRDWLSKADVKKYGTFCKKCEEYGIRWTSKRGREYLCTAMTDDDVRRTLEVADQVLAEMNS